MPFFRSRRKSSESATNLFDNPEIVAELERLGRVAGARNVEELSDPTEREAWTAIQAHADAISNAADAAVAHSANLDPGTARAMMLRSLPGEFAAAELVEYRVWKQLVAAASNSAKSSQ